MAMLGVCGGMWGQLFSRPGPFLVDSLEMLVEMLHPGGLFRAPILLIPPTL